MLGPVCRGQCLAWGCGRGHALHLLLELLELLGIERLIPANVDQHLDAAVELQDGLDGRRLGPRSLQGRKREHADGLRRHAHAMTMGGGREAAEGFTWVLQMGFRDATVASLCPQALARAQTGNIH